MIDPAVAPLIDDAKVRIENAFGVKSDNLETVLACLGHEIPASAAGPLSVLAMAETWHSIELSVAQKAHAQLLRILATRQQSVVVNRSHVRKQIALKLVLAFLLLSIYAAAV